MIELLISLLVLALIFWLVTAYLLPILPNPFRTIILVVLVIIAIVYLLRFLPGGSPI